MDEAESFLMKSRVQSIWPHSRAGWCAEVLERAVSRGATFGVAVSVNHVFWVCRGCRIARAIACKLFALESRAHSGARSVVPARRQLVFLRNRLSALRVRPGWSQVRAIEVASTARGWRAGELRGMGQVSLGCRSSSVSSCFCGPPPSKA